MRFPLNFFTTFCHAISDFMFLMDFSKEVIYSADMVNNIIINFYRRTKVIGFECFYAFKNNICYFIGE